MRGRVPNPGLRQAAGLTLSNHHSNGQPEPRPPPQRAPSLLELAALPYPPLQWWVSISFSRSWGGAGFWEKMALSLKRDEAGVETLAGNDYQGL